MSFYTEKVVNSKVKSYLDNIEASFEDAISYDEKAQSEIVLTKMILNKKETEIVQLFGEIKFLILLSELGFYVEKDFYEEELYLTIYRRVDRNEGIN